MERRQHKWGVGGREFESHRPDQTIKDLQAATSGKFRESSKDLENSAVGSRQAGFFLLTAGSGVTTVGFRR